jgi:hypothetical protein
MMPTRERKATNSGAVEGLKFRMHTFFALLIVRCRENIFL